MLARLNRKSRLRDVFDDMRALRKFSKIYKYRIYWRS
jgi:hypothetical protein